MVIMKSPKMGRVDNSMYRRPNRVYFDEMGDRFVGHDNILPRHPASLGSGECGCSLKFHLVPRLCKGVLRTTPTAYLVNDVSELEEAWGVALAEAEARARSVGRTDLVEYLALRTSNDLLRRTGIEWINSTFEILAGEANRRGAGIQTARDNKHRFQDGNSTMVGTLLTLSSGVRKLSVEAGWPRTPRDGFVRGGGLACANVRHLGIKPASEALLLVLSPKGAPQWVVLEKRGRQAEVHQAKLREH